MDPSKTIEDSPADAKESEGKTEHCQVNALYNRGQDAAFRTPAARINHARRCALVSAKGVNQCESNARMHCMDMYSCVHVIKGVCMLC